MNKPPSPNGTIGERGPAGRFAPGNAGGPGNPFARRVGELRSALIEAVTPADMAEMVAALIAGAESGNVAAIREVFDRTLGKPTQADLLERIEELERRAAELAEPST